LRFWDSSALVPLFIEETGTDAVTALSNQDAGVAAWWGTLVECAATLSRIGRQGQLSREEEFRVRQRFLRFASAWLEIEPSGELRSGAVELAGIHPLRAADALQLSAARLWVEGNPNGREFVCLDRRLREAALREGFRVLPDA